MQRFCLLGVVALWWASPVQAAPTLIAPMLDGIRACQGAVEAEGVETAEVAWQWCQAHQENAAPLIENVFAPFGPVVSDDGRFELGYTLGMPLLSYVRLNESNDVSIDRELIRHDLTLLRDNPRSVVLYLFGNHFVLPDQQEIAQRIAEDERSVMRLADGSTPIDDYFASSIYPWTLGDQGALIDKAKHAASQAVLEEVCALPEPQREKVRALTVLGETHHFFPDFMHGMGYAQALEVTDYSNVARQQFREWLLAQYASLAQLNAALETSFEREEAIEPPSSMAGESAWQHYDTHASGTVAFHGWAYQEEGLPFTIGVYLNGRYIDDATTGLTRLDVAQSVDGLNDSNVGYRYNLDYRMLPPGDHRVTLRFVSSQGQWPLSEHTLTVVAAGEEETQATETQAAAVIQQQVMADTPEPHPPSLHFWPDYPGEQLRVTYNPLAAAWERFREAQVRNEIERYAQAVPRECLPNAEVFSHQVAPAFKASWNEQLFAVEASLAASSHYAPGVNLYGGITYGDAFFDWLDAQGHRHYGVPEMHPMTPQDPELLVEALYRHHASGAVFIAPYFVSLIEDHYGHDPAHDQFRVAPDNPAYGSDYYFEALHRVMNAPAGEQAP